MEWIDLVIIVLQSKRVQLPKYAKSKSWSFSAFVHKNRNYVHRIFNIISDFSKAEVSNVLEQLLSNEKNWSEQKKKKREIK